jgi:hypothetical protein
MPKRYSTKRDQLINTVTSSTTLNTESSNVVVPQIPSLPSPIQVIPVPIPAYRLNEPIMTHNPPFYGSISFFFIFSSSSS